MRKLRFLFGNHKTYPLQITKNNMPTITKVVVSYSDGTTQELDAATIAASVSPVSVIVDVIPGTTPTATITSVTNDVVQG